MSYINLFLDALWEVSLLPMGQQTQFYGTLSFSPDKAWLAVLLASAGAVTALLLHCFIGRIIGRYIDQQQAQNPRYGRIKHAAGRFGWPLLLLSWAPMGPFLPLIATALGMTMWRVIILSGASMVGFYLYQWWAVSA